jgi:hydroxyacylglutathione hydrolase
MQVIPVASTISDNFMYLAVADDECILIDPVDAPVAISAARATGATKFRVFTTHGHPDHAGGNAAVKEALGCQVLGPEDDVGDWEYDKIVADGKHLSLAREYAAVLHLPGHTPGHLALLFGREHIFIGDVLFVGGVGNCRFGGDPGTLFRTIVDELPKAVDELIFHCGHDYAQRNWEFILSVEPGNARAAELLEQYQGHTRADGPITHTIGEERAYNPFIRVEDEDLQTHLFERYPDRETDTSDPAERAFRILRGLRDEF